MREVSRRGTKQNFMDTFLRASQNGASLGCFVAFAVTLAIGFARRILNF